MVDFQSDIEASLQVLKTGGIILYPTDTVWGIGCDATNARAVERIYALKRRPDEKAMIILVPEERDILQYVAAADLRVFDYLRQANKPTTVVYEGAIGLADNLTGSGGTVAIRICQEDFCRHLLKRFRKPLVSTSANLSGQSTPASFMHITDDIKKGVDYIVRYRQTDTCPAQPSAVIKWKNGEILVIRP